MAKHYIAISDDVLVVFKAYCEELLKELTDQSDNDLTPIEKIGIKVTTQELTELLTELTTRKHDSQNRLSKRDASVQPMGGVHSQPSETKTEKPRSVYVKTTTRPYRRKE